MAEAQPALFETGQGSIIWWFDMAIGIAPIHKSVIAEKLLCNRLGVILPVGCDVYAAARF